MDPRLSLVTLGVSDLARARRFYEALGFRAGFAQGDVVFFPCGGLILGLWSRTALAEESGLAAPPPPGAIGLAQNQRSREEVDAVFAQAKAAGARVVRPPRETEWGGYSGTFTDPDGHPWEIAHNPFWPLADDGTVRLP